MHNKIIGKVYLASHEDCLQMDAPAKSWSRLAYSSASAAKVETRRAGKDGDNLISLQHCFCKHNG